MDKFFLYRKAYPIGVLNDEDEYDGSRLAFWMEDDSQEMLSKKIRECQTDVLIIELINIFREGYPNYGSLITLFGFEQSEEEINSHADEKTVTRKYYGIKRIAKDIDSIHMFIERMDDKTLKIRKLFLYFYDLPDVEELKRKIDKVCSGIYFEEGKGLIINENDYTINILNSAK